MIFPTLDDVGMQCIDKVGPYHVDICTPARLCWVISALEVSLNDMHYINSRFTYLLTYCIQETTLYGATVKIHEPLGVIAIISPDEYPLLSFVSLLALAVVRANCVVIVPSEKYPLPALNLYQVPNLNSNLVSGVTVRWPSVPIFGGSPESWRPVLGKLQGLSGCKIVRKSEPCPDFVALWM